uniref:Putative secreted protein n=1 Tax=Anopheles triannulatus TaxID=58253 RepID=A0A2M4B5M3_9DIPT
MASVLDSLIFSFHLRQYFVTCLRALFRELMILRGCFAVTDSATSSSYRYRTQLLIRGKSAMKILNKSGDSTLP